MLPALSAQQAVAEKTATAEYQASIRPSYFPLLYFFAFFYLLGICGAFLFPPKWYIPLCSLVIANFFGLGTTLGFHRCLTHRSFTFKHKWMEWVFATMGTVNLQQGPIWWCSIHRLHHKHSDTEQDPHNSRKGFLYAHLSWLFYLDPRYVLLGKRPGQLTNVNDLTSDPYYRWLDRHYYAPFLIYLIMLGLVGGWFWFFWGGLIPIIYNNHVTYSVNSLSHLFGYRSFKTYPLSDQSKNNFLVGILALGEGWHNNHHAFPNSARHGFFKWWEFDFTYVVVWLLNKLGLVSQVNLPSKGKVQMQNIILL